MDQRLDSCRSYLMLLARMQLHGPKIDPSDVVQQTLLEAHAKREQFTGGDEALLAWLRKVLTNNIRDAVRRARRQKRDVRREQSLQEAMEHSSRQLAGLGTEGSSPSAKAIRTEELLRLSDCLMQLPALQRDAVVLHHLQNWKLRDIAQHMDRSEAAVAGLLHRGLKKLKRQMRPE